MYGHGKHVQDLEKQRRDDEKAAEEAAVRRAEQAARAEERRRVQVSRAALTHVGISAALPSTGERRHDSCPCVFGSARLHACKQPCPVSPGCICQRLNLHFAACEKTGQAFVLRLLHCEQLCKAAGC